MSKYSKGCDTQAFNRLWRLPANASSRMALSVSLIGVVLAVCALRQEQIPYPHNLKEPDSVAEAKELLLSHPARASASLPVAPVAR